MTAHDSRQDGSRAPRWRLRVNADDAGFDRHADDAILASFREGVVRSTSLVAGGPTADQFLARAPRGLLVGWHVDLTEGEALAGPQPELTDGDGRFRLPKSALWEAGLAGALPAEAIRSELASQRAWWNERGRTPAHADGHNHVHLLEPVASALRELLMAVPVRGAPLHEDRVPDGAPAPHPEFWSGDSAPSLRPPVIGLRFGARPTFANFLEDVASFVRQHPLGGTAEFMVHPGRRAGSTFMEHPHRDSELSVLCDPRLPGVLQARGVVIAADEARA